MSHQKWAVFLAVGLVFSAVMAKESKPKKKSNLHLQSSTFKDGGFLPAKCSRAGGNQSPELTWTGVPPKTQCFAIIVDDPDASIPAFVHWVIYNIPAKPTDPTSNTYELLEDFPRDEKTNAGILQGANGFQDIGYDGPAPPSGTHRYYFKLYALDAPVRLPAGETAAQLMKAIHGHVLGWTQIMGQYGHS
ncbi:MAG TPA: YbhB/YbcL family Raf kinase inhibitor-like protein [bacterium]|nr:YbhB/YbcL family Raf kinase inhibitor-like protein [bacterium]